MLYLLDTNACIAVMRNHPLAIKRMAATTPGDCAISTITSYELLTGVEKCSHPAAERAKVDLLLQTVHLIPFDAGAAKEAARLRALLESQGQMIGPYDILLAGHAVAHSLIMVTANTSEAVAHSLIMVTANTSEFARVPGLKLENWLV